MDWACQLLEGLEDLNFKFARRGRIFECAKIDNQEFVEVMSDLENEKLGSN